MYSIDPKGRRRGTVRRPFPAPLLPLLLLVLAVLASSHAVFPFFPLLLVALSFASDNSAWTTGVTLDVAGGRVMD